MISALLKLLVNYVVTMSFMANVLITETHLKTLAAVKTDPASHERTSKDEAFASNFQTQLIDFQSSLFSLECLIMPSLSGSEEAGMKELEGLSHYEFTMLEYAEQAAELESFHRTLEERRIYLWAFVAVFLCCFIFTLGFAIVKVHVHRNRKYYAKAASFLESVRIDGWKAATAKVSVQDYHSYMNAYSYRLFGIWRPVTLSSKSGKAFR